MDGAIRERGCERVVDEPVLVDERQALEARAHDRHLEVVAAARAVDDGELCGVGKGVPEQRLERLRGYVQGADERT